MADLSVSSDDSGAAGIEVPWARVEGFVAKLTHDVRNGLNALELQVTLLGEITEDPEVKEEVKRVRQLLAGMTRQIQAVRVATGVPAVHLFAYPATDFLEDLRERFQKQHHEVAERVQWTLEPGTGSVNVDPEQAIQAVLELLDNAVQQAPAGSPLRVDAQPGDGTMNLSIYQQLAAALPAATDDWGRTPLRSTRRNAYGLGAFHARRTLEAQGAALAYTQADAGGSLVTMVTFQTAGSVPQP